MMVTLEQERWKEEKASLQQVQSAHGFSCCTSEVQSVCVCMCVINNQKGLTNA